MLLVEAYAKKKINIGDYINYNPDYRKCILNPKETGWKKRQQIETEDIKYQFAGIIYGKLMLLADGVSKEYITLGGKIGHTKGTYALERCMKECYSSVELGTKGTCLTEEIFKVLPNRLKYKGLHYWLGTSYIYFDVDYICFGMRSVYGEHLDSTLLFSGYDTPCWICYGVRPAVILPSDIQIDEKNNLVYEK